MAVHQRKSSVARDAWDHSVATYANLCRLHRLVSCHPDWLSDRSVGVVQEVHEWLARGADGVVAFLDHVPRLLPAMITRARQNLRDFAFSWYKVLAMCSHTPTTVVPLYAGFVGIASPPHQKRQGPSWTWLVASLCNTADNFVSEARQLLKDGPLTANAIRRRVRRLPSAAVQRLRTLDCVCFLSTSCLLLQRSLLSVDGIDCVKQARFEVQDCVRQLAAHGVLFADAVEEPHMGWHCVVHPLFWTYDKSQPAVWDLHVFAGILMLFWDL